MNYTYFVTTDTDDLVDDNGAYQASLMTQKVSSATPLTDEQAWEDACAEGNWKVYFGEGDEAKVGDYTVSLC
jgi:hypothetical protein